MNIYDDINEEFEKKYGLDENKSTNLKTALYDIGGKIKTYAILSAENPNGSTFTGQKKDEKGRNTHEYDMYLAANNSRTKDLANTLKPGHFCYIKIKGKYGEDENSVMIINITLDFTLYLAEEYEQESFFWADESGISYYEMNKDTGKYELIEKSKRIDNMQDANDFFSKYHDFKFDIYLNYFHQAVGEAYDEKRLAKSVTEGISEKSRYYSRCGVYKKSYEDILRDLQDIDEE